MSIVIGSKCTVDLSLMNIALTFWKSMKGFLCESWGAYTTTIILPVDAALLPSLISNLIPQPLPDPALQLNTFYSTNT